MERYLNLSGKSGVAFFELVPDFVRVFCKDGGRYLYNHATTGRSNIDTMKTLAKAGQGLNTFINANVRKMYAKKEA
jgi:hypothetical protein